MVHVGLLCWPSDDQTGLSVWFWDDVEVDVVNLLVGDSAVVLQDVVSCLRGVQFKGLGYLLGDWEDLRQVLVWDVV